MAKSKVRTDGGHLASVPYTKPKPSFTLDEKELPEIKDWAVGKKYGLVLEVEMVSHSSGSEYTIQQEGKKHEARFKILSVANAGEEASEKGLKGKKVTN